VTIKQQREGNDAQHERHHREEEADCVADDDELLSCGRRQHVAGESGGRCGRLGAKICHIDRIRHGKPDGKDSKQKKAKSCDRPNGRRMDDVEGVPP